MGRGLQCAEPQPASADNEGLAAGQGGLLVYFISFFPHLPAPSTNCNHKRQMGRDWGSKAVVHWGHGLHQSFSQPVAG